MVTFTLPEKLCRHFFTPAASDVYQLFFAAAQASPSTLQLPMLRRGNETDWQLPPTLARPSRPAAEEKTPKPRQMTSRHQLHPSRRFRFPGPGADELCPRCGKHDYGTDLLF